MAAPPPYQDQYPGQYSPASRPPGGPPASYPGQVGAPPYPPSRGYPAYPGYAGYTGYAGYGPPLDEARPLVQVEYAGWWQRFFAYCIDSVILSVAVAVLEVGLQVVVNLSAEQVNEQFAFTFTIVGILVILAVPFWYFPGQWASRGQTLGQRALHIMVVRQDGECLTFMAGLVRWLVGGILDVIVLGLPLGYLWAAWDTKKQAWHDKLVGSVVIRV